MSLYLDGTLGVSASGGSAVLNNAGNNVVLTAQSLSATSVTASASIGIGTLAPSYMLTLNGGNLGFTTGTNGIIFNNSSALANSVLNDYETGTWTPSVSASSGSITSYTSSGFYTKVGRMVCASFTVVITNNGTGSGAVYVSLPFACPLSGDQPQGTGRENVLTGYQLQMIVGGSSTAAVRTYNNNYPGGTNAGILGTIVYSATF